MVITIAHQNILTIVRRDFNSAF